MGVTEERFWGSEESQMSAHKGGQEGNKSKRKHSMSDTGTIFITINKAIFSLNFFRLFLY